MNEQFLTVYRLLHCRLMFYFSGSILDSSKPIFTLSCQFSINFKQAISVAKWIWIIQNAVLQTGSENKCDYWNPFWCIYQVIRQSSTTSIIQVTVTIFYQFIRASTSHILLKIWCFFRKKVLKESQKRQKIHKHIKLTNASARTFSLSFSGLFLDIGIVLSAEDLRPYRIP